MKPKTKAKTVADKLVAYKKRKSEILCLRHNLDMIEADHQNATMEDFGVADGRVI